MFLLREYEEEGFFPSMVTRTLLSGIVERWKRRKELFVRVVVLVLWPAKLLLLFGSCEIIRLSVQPINYPTSDLTCGPSSHLMALFAKDQNQRFFSS